MGNGTAVRIGDLDMNNIAPGDGIAVRRNAEFGAVAGVDLRRPGNRQFGRRLL
jgi:hypothetical protein